MLVQVLWLLIRKWCRIQVTITAHNLLDKVFCFWKSWTPKTVMKSTHQDFTWWKGKVPFMNTQTYLFHFASELNKWGRWWKALLKETVIQQWGQNGLSFLPLLAVLSLRLWLWPSLPQQVYQITEPLHRFLAWRFLQRFVGLPRQTAKLGPGLIFRTVFCFSLLAPRHDNGDQRTQKVTNKGRQGFKARAICQFSLASFQELSQVKAGAGKGWQGRAEKSLIGNVIAIWKAERAGEMDE